jgi:hypothetical protein
MIKFDRARFWMTWRRPLAVLALVVLSGAAWAAGYYRMAEPARPAAVETGTPAVSPAASPSVAAASPSPTAAKSSTPPPARMPAPVAGNCTNPRHVLRANPSDPQDGVTLSGYYVATDTWNFSSYPGSQQTMYVCDYNNWYALVNLTDRAHDGAVKTYPNVHKDFDGPALNSFHTITSTFAHTAPAGSAYDFAYDIWLNDQKIELMVWTQSDGRQAHVPGMPAVGNVTIGGVAYTIHKNGSYIAYDMQTTHTSGAVDLLAIMRDAVARGYVPASARLGQIDYGAEVCDTGGADAKFAVTGFSLAAN